MTSDKGLKRHIFTVHDQRRCEDCGKVFDDFENLWKHRSSYDCSVVGIYVCEFCKIQYKIEGALEIHKENVHGVSRSITRQKHVCPECGISVLDLNEHLRTVHSNVTKYLCHFCDKKFKSKIALSGHIRYHHKSTPVLVSTCPYCNKKVKYLHSHIEKKKCYLPPNERPKLEFPCQDCGKVFTHKNNLRCHLSRVHGELKQCSFCDFKTKYPQNLKMHIKTVHERKPVKETCPYCSKICVSLEWHISTYHSSI